MSEIENATNGSETIEKGFFGKLSNGDFGLAKTYWRYGVGVQFVVRIAAIFIIFILSSLPAGTLEFLLVIVSLAFTAYAIPLGMGIWRAANKYEGSKIWATLAKANVILGVFVLALNLLALFF
jgi:hypothetical protein